MIERRTIGLNFSGRAASFCTWAPHAESVQFKTDTLTVDLEKRPLGFWESGTFEIENGVLYSVVVDGKPLPDPASLYQPDGVFGESAVFNLNQHNWTDDSWKGISFDDLIMYEIHTGTFSEEGTFQAIGEKLEYLKELGINAIELMPVSQFSGSRNWGYDGVFPFAVQNSYGGPAQLQQLVDNCHQHDIAVILDVVLNHVGPEGNVLNEFGPYFTDKYRTPWGRAINFDDAWCDGVRIFFIENILMWLRDFHIDGIRLDAVHTIWDFSPRNIIADLHHNVMLLNAKTLSAHFLIAECDLNDVKYISPVSKGGYGLDAVWCDEFHHAIHTLATKERGAWFSDFGSTWHLVKAYNDVFVYDGLWSEHRKKIFGTRTAGFNGRNFIVFSQNHDQVGNRMLGERLTSLVDFEMLKLMAGAVFFGPFIPLLFMGEEYAEKNPFLYFTSHQNEELIRMVREGRKREFEISQLHDEVPDPQDEKTFMKSKLTLGQKEPEQLAMLEYYKYLINLRKTLPVWKSTDRTNFLAESLNGKKVLKLTRKGNSEILLAILNFEDTVTDVITCRPYVEWELILNSADSQWAGPGNFVDTDNPSITVPPHSIIILYSA